MVIRIHDATIVKKGRIDRKTNREIQKTCVVVCCSKFIKGVDKVDQYLNFYSILRKTVKCSKKWYCIC
jgi:hypothetical protein